MVMDDYDVQRRRRTHSTDDVPFTQSSHLISFHLSRESFECRVIPSRSCLAAGQLCLQTLPPSQSASNPVSGRGRLRDFRRTCYCRCAFPPSTDRSVVLASWRSNAQPRLMRGSCDARKSTTQTACRLLRCFAWLTSLTDRDHAT